MSADRDATEETTASAKRRSARHNLWSPKKSEGDQGRVQQQPLPRGEEEADEVEGGRQGGAQPLGGAEVEDRSVPLEVVPQHQTAPDGHGREENDPELQPPAQGRPAQGRNQQYG